MPKKAEIYEKYIRGFPYKLKLTNLIEIHSVVDYYNNHEDNAEGNLIVKNLYYFLLKKKGTSLTSVNLTGNQLSIEFLITEDWNGNLSNKSSERIEYSGKVRVLNNKFCEIIFRKKISTGGIYPQLAVYRHWCLYEYVEDFLSEELRKINIAISIFNDEQ